MIKQIEKIKFEKRDKIDRKTLRIMNQKIYDELGNNMDYISSIGKALFIEYLILKSIDPVNTLSVDDQKIFDSCKNILYTKRDVYFKDPTYSGDDYLFGYKIAENGKLEYYKLDDKKTNFIKVSPQERKSIEKSTNKRISLKIKMLQNCVDI